MPYNAGLHIATNKALGIGQAAPTDARSYFLDETLFVYRPFISLAEVLSYLNNPVIRHGNFSIYINTGGTLNPDGTITGGATDEYWFKDGIADTNLVKKELYSGGGGGGGAIPRIVELTIGDPLAANPPGSATPAGGAQDVTLNLKVIPDSEIIFYQGIVVRKAPAPDFNYTAIYNASNTVYHFSGALMEGFVLRFNVLT